MPSDPLFRDKFLRPELFLGETIRKTIQGKYLEKDENVQVLYRALVVAVDVKGGQLENPNGSGKVTHTVDGKSYDVQASAGPQNPKNSIKAKIITDGFDQFTHDDNIRTFWPFFPEHDSIPIKPGEYVYVIFEDPRMVHGLWVTKIPGMENVNFYRGSDVFQGGNGSSLASKYPDTANVGDGSQTEKLDDDQAALESNDDNNLSELF